MEKLHRFFFYLTIFFLPTQLGLHFWPEWATVLGRRVDYLSPTIYLTDILILLTLVSWILELFKTRHSRANGNPSFFKAWIPAFPSKLRVNAGMTSLVVINIFFAANKPVAIFHWLKVLEFGLFGLYIVKTKPSLLLITYLLSLAVLYSSIIAMLQFFLQHSIGGPLWFLGERQFNINTPGIARIDFDLSLITYHLSLFKLRPYATFPHPNVLGGFLAATLPLIIGLISQMGQIGPKKTFFFVVFMSGFIALFLTFSRSAIVVSFAAILLVFLSKKPKRLRFLILALLFFLSLITYHLSPLDLTSESVVVRQHLNAAAVKMWQQSPILGVGLGNFLIHLPEVLPSRTVYFLQPVHNIYLLVLSETGVVGLFTFLLFLWRAIRDKKKVISKTANSFFISYRLSLIAYLFLGLVDHYPLTIQQGQLLLTVFLSLSLLKNKV